MLSLPFLPQRWPKRRSLCWKAAGTHGNGVSTVKCFRTHYGRHCQPFSVQNALYRRSWHIQVHHFSAGNIPGTRSAKGVPLPHPPLARVKRQTPISTWPSSVPIVPVLMTTALRPPKEGRPGWVGLDEYRDGKVPCVKSRLKTHLFSTAFC